MGLFPDLATEKLNQNAALYETQFSIRSTGGARIVTAIETGTGAPTAGVSIGPGGTGWASLWDRNAKKNFRDIDPIKVLDKLSSMPIQSWQYRWEDDSSTPHLGPVAQEFKAAFYPGRNDKTISTQKVDGVALAAIRGLNQKLAQKDHEIEALRNELAELRTLMTAVTTQLKNSSK